MDVSLLYRAIYQKLWQSEEEAIIVSYMLVFKVADQGMTARRTNPENVLGMRLEVEAGHEPHDHKARLSLAMRLISTIAVPRDAAVSDLNGSRIVSWRVQ